MQKNNTPKKETCFVANGLYNVSKMEVSPRQLDFLSFCIEMYANEKGLSGQNVFRQFDKFGILEYLSDNYEALHTQGMGYIIPLLDNYMKEPENIR